MNSTFEIPHPYRFKQHIDWPVDIGIAAGGILGYIFAWIGMVCYLQLSHWVAGVSGALAGGLVGWLWFWLVVRNRTILKGCR